ncbi:MAG TPA: DUF4126 family protein [Longimicrobiales bacterium]|nr:DUF4126 family protein [Longimicrobiales bacterium]
MSRIRSVFFGALGVGVVSGMRTFLMPALLSRASPAPPGTSSANGAAHLLRSPAVSNALALASLGELIGDKLPMAPDRTEVPSLAARAVSGGFAATVIASWNSEAAVPAAVLGSVGAIGSAHVMVRLRTAIGRRLDIPDPLVGLAEDCLALAIGHILISTAEGNQAATGP